MHDRVELSAVVAIGLREEGVATVIVPGDKEYEDARHIWNGDIDRHPALIVQCKGVADVIAAINAARDGGLPLSIRGGAHNAAGHAIADGGVVVDVSRMKGIRIDPKARVATAQTGVLWGELDRESQAFGLATPGGMISNTGIAGLTLGGGEGWLMGKFGLSVDNVLGLDVVTADGHFRRASAEENPDLYWALRGGGGNFGVVTVIEYRLHEHGPMVFGGRIVHPIDNGVEVLRFYRDFSSDLPDEAELFAAVRTLPEVGPVVILLPGYNGDSQQGQRFFEPVLGFGTPIMSQVGPMLHVARQSYLDAGSAEHGLLRYWKSGYASALSDALIDIVVAAARDFSSPRTALTFFRVHGAAARVPATETAFGMRGNKWDFNILTQWQDPAETARHKDWTRAVWGRLDPLTSGTAYVNHMSGEETAAVVRASYGPNYDRLAQVKAKYDPDNIFRLNANIRPAA